jgi:hypothetical protein
MADNVEAEHSPLLLLVGPFGRGAGSSLTPASARASQREAGWGRGSSSWPDLFGFFGKRESERRRDPGRR